MYIISAVHNWLCGYWSYVPCIPTSDFVGDHHILLSINHIRYNPNSYPLISVLLYSSKQNTEKRSYENKVWALVAGSYSPQIRSHNFQNKLRHHDDVCPRGSNHMTRFSRGCCHIADFSQRWQGIRQRIRAMALICSFML